MLYFLNALGCTSAAAGIVSLEVQCQPEGTAKTNGELRTGSPVYLDIPSYDNFTHYEDDDGLDDVAKAVALFVSVNFNNAAQQDEAERP